MDVDGIGGNHLRDNCLSNSPQFENKHNKAGCDCLLHVPRHSNLFLVPGQRGRYSFISFDSFCHSSHVSTSCCRGQKEKTRLIDFASIVQLIYQTMPVIYVWYVAIGVAIILVNDLTFIPLAVIHRRLQERYRRFDDPPLVSVLVPAHNEEKNIESLLQTLFEQTYQNLEIVVVNDGSTDNTRRILEPYAYVGRIRLVNLGPPNVGKHGALNTGMKVAKGEFFVVVDADGILEREAIANMILPFSDPNVMSVSGNVRVANRINLLTRCQALEYVRDINIPRRAFDLLNITLVIPGPLGAFRRSVTADVGQYDADTVTEDFDLTVKIQKARNGKQIASRCLSNAVAYSEAPENLAGLIRQRKRWYGGMSQTFRKHQRNRMWRGSGAYSRVGVPYLFITLFILPVLELITTSLTLIGFFLAPFEILVAFLIFTAMETLTSVIAITMDHEDYRLVFLSPLYVFGYRQLLDLIRIYSYGQALLGRLSWEKPQRMGGVSTKARSALRT